MSTWAKMQLTIAELRAELTSVQATIAKLDDALVERAAKARKYTSANGVVDLNCATGEIKLAGVGASLEDHSSLCIDPGQEVKPLQMGKVTFYGESARQIRATNAVLQSAGAGQLEVVKYEPFKVTVDGCVYISEALVGKAAVHFKVQKATTEQGRCVAAGFGLGAQTAEQPKPPAADDLLDLTRAQISESRLGTELIDRIALIEQGMCTQGGENRAVYERLAAIELGLTAQKGINDAARVRIDQRIDALQAQVDNLQGKVYS